MTLLTEQEQGWLWYWLETHGFSRAHMPNDAELARLVDIAKAEECPWPIQRFLQQANQLQEAA